MGNRKAIGGRFEGGGKEAIQGSQSKLRQRHLKDSTSQSTQQRLKCTLRTARKAC